MRPRRGPVRPRRGPIRPRRGPVRPNNKQNVFNSHNMIGLKSYLPLPNVFFQELVELIKAKRAAAAAQS